MLRAVTGDPRLDVAVHRGVADPRRALVYVANPTAEPITAHVVPVPGAELGEVHDVWHDVKVEPTGGGFEVRLGAHDIAVHACTLDESEENS